VIQSHTHPWDMTHPWLIISLLCYDKELQRPCSCNNTLVYLLQSNDCNADFWGNIYHRVVAVICVLLQSNDYNADFHEYLPVCCCSNMGVLVVKWLCCWLLRLCNSVLLQEHLYCCSKIITTLTFNNVYKFISVCCITCKTAVTLLSPRLPPGWEV